MRKIVEKINFLLNKEKGTIKKDHGGKTKICLIYPNVYKIGISNLGFQAVYRLFNERKDVVCERSFLPYPEDVSEYRESTLLSFESKKPLYEFDILAFSLCFENDYPNILKILALSKIPLLSKDRKPYHPLLIAGGVLCFSNSEPIANVFDVIFVGEAEELIDTFLNTYSKVKNSSYEEDFKKNFKEQLIKFDGFYIPEAYEEIYDSSGKIRKRKILWKEAPEKIKKIYCNDFTNKFNFSQITTPESIFPNMFLIETMRGCPFSCRFCLVGHVFNPLRKASIKKLKMKLQEINELDRQTVGLIAPSLSAYKEISELLKNENIELSFTSLRADKSTVNILDYLIRRKTLTLAPEAGSERLRRIIKKGILEEDLLLIAEKLSEKGLESLKLYFMIGLPFERDEDIDEMIRLINKIRTRFQRKITASISIFVPKPHTPFQWHRMEDYETVKEKLKKLKKDLIKIKGFNLLHEVPKYSYMQGFLSRANRTALPIIKRVSEGENFNRILEEVKFQLYSIRDFNDLLPWDFIEHEGLTKEHLWEEYKKAESIADELS